jgi:hypothetical protein
MAASTSQKASFRANLVSLRTLLIFAAGFALALLLARVLPSAELFHPEAQVHEKDVVIALINGSTVASIRGLATSEGEGFAGGSEVWDGDLLNEVIQEYGLRGNNLSIPARITYVVPREGPVELIRVERRR